MNLQLSRPIAFFDLETTGINLQTDRIIEIAILRINPDLSEQLFLKLVNPEMPIPQQAIDVHHITNEMVADKPTFKELAPEVLAFIENCDLAGYNINRFDVPLLAEECYRTGFDLGLDKRKMIDVQVVFHKMEERTLKAAYKFYCQKELIDAHSAEADTRATYEVLKAQLDHYPQLINTVDYLSEFTSYRKTPDLENKFRYDENEEIVFNFGKHKDKYLKQVFVDEPSYYYWMMEKDFLQSTKALITKVWNDLKNK